MVALDIATRSGVERSDSGWTWTANVALSYEIPSTIGKFSIAANFYYNDGWAADADNRLQQKSYELLDGSITWRSQNDKISVSVWGRNLTDEFYYDSTQGGNYAFVAPGRSALLTTSLNF